MRNSTGALPQLVCAIAVGLAGCPGDNVGAGDEVGETGAPECNTDADCTDPNEPHCGPQNTCVECIGDVDCADPDDPYCGADGFFGECTQNLHCTTPEQPVCDGHECVECVAQGDCTDGVHTACASNQCVLPCDTDAHEPNDLPGSAVLVEDTTEIVASLCPGDSDWFEFLTLGPTYVGLQAVFPGTEGDLDFEIEQVGGGFYEVVHGRTLAYSKNLEGLHRRLPSAGSYRVRVFLAGGVGGLPYRMRFDLLPEG